MFSSTKSKIYDKEKHKQLRVIISYKYVMDSNTLLFEPSGSKIGNSSVRKVQVASMYVQTVAQ